jgi:hypothetical protein
MNDVLLLCDSEEIPQKITRALEEGSDYQPHWRHCQVEEYLKAIYREDEEALRQVRLDQILEKEADPLLRDLLCFRCGCLAGNAEAAIDYALKCWRDNPKTLSASRIKAMIVGNGTPERIAHEMGTTADRIDIFEKLFFDVRRYLPHRGWLATVCLRPLERDALITVESRWLAVAFRRGWAGVEEVVLGHVDKGCERSVKHLAGILLGRAEDYCWNLEASGIAPSERDLAALWMVARIASTGLPLLWDQEQPPTMTPGLTELAGLSFAGRDRVFSLLNTLFAAPEKKTSALESQGSKIQP